jgi:sterol desaturase/sphingolipid hydroxylase (fatty acid hydroxylase superfamily)
MARIVCRSDDAAMRGPRYTLECLETAQAWPPKGQARSDEARALGKSMRVFASPWMDGVLGRAHPITPVVWFGPFIGWAIYRAVDKPDLGPSALALFALGWLAWSLIEYLLHRFIFHMSAHTPKEKLRAFLLHGYHHEFPDDAMRLVAPPLMSWPIGIVVGFAYYGLLGATYWMFLYAGTAAGYIAYDWIHFYTHHFRPRRGIGKWLRSYHMLHHFGEPGWRFGVSSPFWDVVFGTYLPVRRREGAGHGTGRSKLTT